jgi:hypothetical protein
VAAVMVMGYFRLTDCQLSANSLYQTTVYGKKKASSSKKQVKNIG